MLPVIELSNSASAVMMPGASSSGKTGGATLTDQASDISEIFVSEMKSLQEASRNFGRLCSRRMVL
jgi:hypothetical protein